MTDARTGSGVPSRLVDDFASLAIHIAGIRLSPRAKSEARSVLARAFADSGAASWREFDQRLHDPAGARLVARLVGELTVKETYFFRNGPQFDALDHLVVPEVVRVRRLERPRDSGLRPVRVWSAGCSTGEEAWSLAMALLDLPAIPAFAWDVCVLATDISRSALATAREGVYPFGRFHGAPDHLLRLAAKFGRREEDRWTVGSAPRRIVDFAEANVFADAPPLDCDVVFCRNVMIYLPSQRKPELLDQLWRALRPGGWLFLGDAEVLNAVHHEFETVLFDGGVAYRRPGGAS